MPELAYLNGDILPIEAATVSIEDRGYQFGDAVYEYIASYNGRLFCMPAHLNRLRRSLRELDFPSISKEKVREGLVRLFDQAKIARAGVYIQISRGVAPRAHAFPTGGDVQTVMTIRELPDTHLFVDTGATAITQKDFRWGRCDIKTVQLVPNVLAKQKALDAGAYDTIFISDEGIVREATSSNVFIITDGRAVTHPLTPNILPGITRSIILDCCREKKIPVEERFYSVEDLHAADEVFLTGTTTEVLSIVSVDDTIIGEGRVGAHTAHLYKALRERATRLV